jgi:hypothetical protein
MAPQKLYSDKDLFDEMERIWTAGVNVPQKPTGRRLNQKLAVVLTKTALVMGALVL